MNDNERDERLGAALRQLDAPDHAPGFWDDLAGRLSDDAPGPVVRLDQERTRRRRFVPLAAAAAVVAALLGAGVVIGDKNNADPGRRVVADRPPAVAAAPAMVTIAFADKGVPESGAAGNSVLTVAQDGSYRWTSADGIVDIAYDAEAGRVVQSADPEDRKVAYIFTDLPPGGPDAPVPVTEPLGPLGDFVVSLARAGNKQVTEATHAGTGREVWRYDGPVAADRLSGGMSPDHVLAEVDRETGVVLTMHSTISGRAFQNLDATKIETHETVDRSRFTFPADPNGTSTFSRGFKPMSPEEAADAVPYPILVPEDVPDGFVLDAVAVNQKVPMGTGAEGMNPPVANVVSMRWSKGYLSFSVTLRPVDGQVWDDPFGREGRVFRKIPLKVALEGRPPLEGDLVVDGGTHPHFWGITRDIVVTADGDLTAQEFLRLAESLRG